MKEFLGEYIKIISKSLIGLLFGLGFFYLLLNAFHASSLNKKVYVTENDVYYAGYLDNVLMIKENLDNYRYEREKFAYDMPTLQRISSDITTCYNILNSDKTLLRYKEGMYIGYKEVYDLNVNFINSFGDECFISNLTWIVRDEKLKDSLLAKKVFGYTSVNNILSGNGLYIKDELRDNSSYYYNTAISNSMIRNDLASSYQMVARNYYYFSNMLLDISEYLMDGDYND